MNDDRKIIVIMENEGNVKIKIFQQLTEHFHYNINLSLVWTFRTKRSILRCQIFITNQGKMRQFRNP